MAQTIFLTGSSGLVGNRCAIRALQAGYRVIASVRSESKAENVRKSIAQVCPVTNLEFIIIPDMAVKGVFDDIARSADYIVHLASPLWTVTDFSDMDQAFIQVWTQNNKAGRIFIWTNMNQPAYLGVVNMLEAAFQAPSVKKVVLCSSLAALATKDQIFGDDVNGATYTSNNRVPDSYYDTVKSQEHYFAGKTKALNATDGWAKKPLHFDIINVFPSTVLGRFELASTPDELLANSNIRGLAIAVGKTLDPTPTTSVHVDDLAKIHIDILAMKTEKYHNFGAGIQVVWEDQVDIVQRRFPDAVREGIFSSNGKIPDRPFLFDCAETEGFFGWNFKSFEEQVFDLAEQYLKLVQKSAVV
jgi:nucleoside-diphosphate-sugar epimerase